jgi:pyruvate formate lyase activating enzyme
VRARRGDEIRLTTYGRSSGFCIDPIEKKPLNHFLPGTPVLSFGTAGCNLTCKFCQNWDISKAHSLDRLQSEAAPETIVHAAQETAAALLTRLFPEKAKPEAEVARPLFLDVAALETPYLALANAAREILRMGDLVDALLRLVPAALFRSDKTVTEQAAKLGRELDRLYEAVKVYLAKLDWAT